MADQGPILFIRLGKIGSGYEQKLSHTKIELVQINIFGTKLCFRTKILKWVWKSRGSQTCGPSALFGLPGDDLNQHIYEQLLRAQIQRAQKTVKS